MTKEEAISLYGKYTIRDYKLVSHQLHEAIKRGEYELTLSKDMDQELIEKIKSDGYEIDYGGGTKPIVVLN